jgi:hypothetical protein
MTWVDKPKRADFGSLIVPDLPDIVSPVDGTIMHGRRGMREHMKEHNLIHTEELKGDFERNKKEREAFYTNAPDPQRAHDIARAMEQRRRRP